MSSRLLPGEIVLGRFQMVCCLGFRGSSETFLAEDFYRGRRVVLEFLSPEHSAKIDSDPDLASSFARACELDHPFLGRLYEMHRLDDRLFIARASVEGESCGDLLRQGWKFSLTQATQIIEQACLGLETLHRAGVLHLDLQPDKIFLTPPGPACLIHSGLPGLDPISDHLESASPEQLRGEPPTARSDLFAVGLVLRQLLTGQQLFNDDKTLARRERNLALLEQHRRFQQPATRSSLLPSKLGALIKRCLAPDPDERPHSALEIAESLRPWLPEIWSPAPGKSLPNRPDLTLKQRIDEPLLGETWLALHRPSGSLRRLMLGLTTAEVPRLQSHLERHRHFRKRTGMKGEQIALLRQSHFTPLPAYLEWTLPPGRPLPEWFDEAEQIEPRQRVDIVRRAAEIVASMHGCGMSHLDLRPETFYIEGSGDTVQVGLRDLGLERSELEERLQANPKLRNLAHLAPELLAEKVAATPEVDVYALGTLLYQLATGELGRKPENLPSTIEDEILRDEIVEALRQDPEKRIGHAAVLACHLRELETRRQRHRELVQLRAETRFLVQQREKTLTQIARQKRYLAIAAVIWMVLLAIGFDQSREEQRMTDQALHSLSSILELPDPVRGLGAHLNAQRFLDESAMRIEAADLPASVMRASAAANQGLGRPHRANEQLKTALVSLRPRSGNDTRRKVDLLAGLAESNRQLADYPAATSVITAAQHEELVPGVDDPVRASLLMTTARVKGDLGQWEEAEALYRQGLAVQRSANGAGGDPSDLIQSLNDFAGFLLQQDDLVEAEAVLHEARDLAESHLGSPPLASLSRRFGQLARVQLSFAEAGSHLEEALQIAQRRLGADHPEAAEIWRELAKLDRDLGRFDEAEGRLRKALDIDKKILGEHHPRTADRWRELGMLAADRGRYEEALRKTRRGLKILVNRFGQDHPSVLAAQGEAAQTLAWMKLDDQAELLYRNILEQQHRRSALMPATSTRLRLAEVLLRQQRAWDAEDLKGHVTLTLRLLAGWPSLELGRNEAHLGHLCALMGDPGQARFWLEQALDTFDQLGRRGRIDSATTHRDLACLLFEHDRPLEALTASRQSLHLLEGLLPAEHWRFAWTRAIEGVCMLRLGREAEGAALIETALSELRARKGEQARETLEVELLSELHLP